MAKSSIIYLLIAIGLQSQEAVANPVPAPQAKGPEPKCGQWDFKATLLNSTRAIDRVDCYLMCSEYKTEKGACTVSLFDPFVPNEELNNCFYYDSTKPSNENIMFLAGQSLCAPPSLQPMTPPLPKDGCPQMNLNGTVLSTLSAKSATDCMSKCQANAQCTHALFRRSYGFLEDQCRLFRENPTGPALRFFPEESVCTKLVCGQWEARLTMLSFSMARNNEECSRLCRKAGCDAFLYNPLEGEGGCPLFKSDPKNNLSFIYNSGEQLCSINNYRGLVPPTPEDACPQIFTYGNEIPFARQPGTTVAACTARCDANKNCTHSLFNTKVDGTSVCTLFRENNIERELRYIAGQSICPRTNPGEALKLPSPLPKGSPPKCGQWEFAAMELTSTKTANETECQAACAKTPQCDAYMFDRRLPEVANALRKCQLFNSKERGQVEQTYFFGNQICSTVFESQEKPLPVGGCPPTRVFGEYLNDHFLYATSTANCMNNCISHANCTHSVYNIDRTCSMVQQIVGAEEIAYLPGDSICPKVV